MFKNLWRHVRAWWGGSYESNLKRELKIQSDEIERMSAIRQRIAAWVREECDRSYREGFLAGRASTRGQP